MKQRVIEGIEVDICPASGGVWLDKGELEKLIAKLREAVDDSDDDFMRFKQQRSQPHVQQVIQQPMPQYAPPQYAKYDDDDYKDYHKYKHKKKHGMMNMLGDLFD
jgi:Zn-finger nucleic acid-binding protein